MTVPGDRRPVQGVPGRREATGRSILARPVTGAVVLLALLVASYPVAGDVPAVAPARPTTRAAHAATPVRAVTPAPAAPSSPAPSPEPPAPTAAWDEGSGRNLPATLYFTHSGRLYRWNPCELYPSELAGHGWGRPTSPVVADPGGDTAFFAAYRVDRSGGRSGVNINVCNIFRNSPHGIEMITKDWDVSTSPDFSRDGRTLIFVSNHHATLRQLLPMVVTTEIYIIKRPWLIPKRLTLDGGFKFNPRLSPDGNRIVYMWINGTEAGLYVYDMATRTTRRIGPAGDYPTWTQDGEAVTYGVNGRFRTIALPRTGHPAPEPESLDVEPAGTYVSYPRWTDHGLVYSWSRGGHTGVSVWDPVARRSHVLVSGTGDFGGADLADRASAPAGDLPTE